jgi:hypothetical protein
MIGMSINTQICFSLLENQAGRVMFYGYMALGLQENQTKPCTKTFMIELLQWSKLWKFSATFGELFAFYLFLVYDDCPT